MLFSSPVFLFLFLPLLLSLYFLAPVQKRNALLLLSSLFFYAWGEVFFVLLMLASIVANYAFGRLIDKNRAGPAKTLLVVAICFNLLLLIAFKYTNFIVLNLNFVLQELQLPTLPQTQIHLPLGISFFTFQAMSYVIDVYRGTAQVQGRLTNVALYIALFPQLIAGPIVRYHDLASQITGRVVTSSLFFSGVRRFLMGLGKKMLVANPLGLVADQVFATPVEQLDPALCWLGIVCYALQIYFDFSGYSDMAIGLGRMFGFRFLENFNYPYIAQSLQDFWRRWHISLSRWFRDYLYIPLGGNRRGNARTYFNLLVVFLLCGIWHGASWNFVVWGLIHGAFLALERGSLGTLLKAMPAPARHAYTLLVVCIAWVFFRADDIHYALDYLVAMFGAGAGVSEPGFVQRLFLQPETLMAMSLGVVLATPVYQVISREYAIPVLARRPVWHFASQLWLFGIIGLLGVLAVGTSLYSPFIYFRF